MGIVNEYSKPMSFEDIEEVVASTEAEAVVEEVTKEEE